VRNIENCFAVMYTASHKRMRSHCRSQENVLYVAADANEKTLTGNVDGCKLFIECKIRCEVRTKHPYRVRDLNDIRSKRQTQVVLTKKICDAVSGASTHVNSVFSEFFSLLAEIY